MPRILHVSDTHLGFQAYSRLTAEGLNQREVDAQDAFRRFVDAAVEDPPDVVVHAGDLFDHPRPTNRAIGFALQQMRRLSEAGIPTVLVSGNHDAPRLRETGSIFRVFDGLPNIHPVYGGTYEHFQLGSLRVHAVPQGITQEAFQAQLAAVDPAGPGPHILVVHGSVLGVDGLFTSEFNEYQIPLSLLRPEFDYVALGHFHNHKKVAANAWYSGSTESFSFNESNQDKGWIEVDIAGGEPRVTLRSSDARPMVDLGALHGTDPNELTETVRAQIQAAPPGAIVRLAVEGLDRPAARSVDWDALRGVRPDLCHVDLRLRLADSEHAVDGTLELGPLAQEFEGFLGRHPMQHADREKVKAAALRYLADAGGARGAA